MNQSDIEYLIRLLNNAIKYKDWDVVEEVKDYLSEFQEDPDDEIDE